LAKEIGVPAQRISAIASGKRAITADSDLRLCRFLGLSDGWWLRLQADDDIEVARASLAKTLAKIRPRKEAAEQRRMRPEAPLSGGSVATVRKSPRRLDPTQCDGGSDGMHGQARRRCGFRIKPINDLPKPLMSEWE
jgi:plasmid maintenance system antidote protein VapI